MASENQFVQVLAKSSEAPPQLGRIPTEVIRFGQRAAPSVMSSSCSSSDSEEETVNRKRPTDLPVETGIQTKVIRYTTKCEHPVEVVRVTPIRPVCSVYMVSYNQEYPIDKNAPEVPKIVEERIAGMKIDLSEISPIRMESVSEHNMDARRKRDLEQHIFADRYKTVWHAQTIDSSGEGAKWTVPFTTDIADIFNSYDDNTVPVDIKNQTYRFAVDRAFKLTDFKELFSQNDPNAGCHSAPHADLTKFCK